MAERMGHDGAMAVPRKMAAGFPWFPTEKPTLLLDDDPLDLDHDSNRITCHRPAPGTTLMLPQGFTPRYKYPLLVWVGDNDGTHRLADWLPRISDQNYIAVEVPQHLCQSDGLSSPANRLQRLLGTLRTIASEYPIHPDRVHLICCGPLAQTGLEWFCQRPDQFTGYASLNGEFTSPISLRAAANSLANRRALLVQESPEVTPAVQEVTMLLQALKVRVFPQTAITTNRPKEACGQQVNHWLMSSIPSAIVH